MTHGHICDIMVVQIELREKYIMYILRNCVNDNQVQTHMTWPTRVDALNYVWENFERGVVWVDVNDRPAVLNH